MLMRLKAISLWSISASSVRARRRSSSNSSPIVRCKLVRHQQNLPKEPCFWKEKKDLVMAHTSSILSRGCAEQKQSKEEEYVARLQHADGVWAASEPRAPFGAEPRDGAPPSYPLASIAVARKDRTADKRTPLT